MSADWTRAEPIGRGWYAVFTTERVDLMHPEAAVFVHWPVNGRTSDEPCEALHELGAILLGRRPRKPGPPKYDETMRRRTHREIRDRIRAFRADTGRWPKLAEMVEDEGLGYTTSAALSRACRPYSWPVMLFLSETPED